MTTLLILLIPLFFFLALFLWFYFKRPASLWLGFWSLALFFSVLLFCMGVLSFFFAKNPLFFSKVAGMLLLLLLLGVVLFTLLLFIVPITSGIRLIKREGFRLSHMLSLFFGIAYFLYLFLWPLLIQNAFDDLLYRLLSSAVFYFSFIFLLFTVSALFYFRPHCKKEFDYIIVLGSGLIKGKVPPLLASRIDTGLKYAEKEQLNQSKFIFSGGQGKDESRPEGEAMAEYAINKGLCENRIIIEPDSTSTQENIAFSYELVKNDWHKQGKSERPNLLIVTNRFHVFRALLTARKQNIPCQGLGAPSKFYFSLNAFLREYIAYLVMKKKLHASIFLIWFSFILLSSLLQFFAMPL